MDKEPGELQSMGLQKSQTGFSDLTTATSPITVWCPLLFDFQRTFVHMCSVSFAPGMGNM